MAVATGGAPADQAAGGRPGIALTVAIEGPIGPATARHVKDGLAEAGKRRATVVILRLNTPGGLATSMREIIADVLGSPVPVVGFVAPAGAHAASAGTYILYATHVAAMAPGTNLGAATPVQIGGPLPGLPGGEGDKKPGQGKDGTSPAPGAPDASTAKATNDAVALIRSLAELRGRNATWAEKAVREAASLSSPAALQEGVIDLIARGPDDLLARIDGRSVELAHGASLQLATRGLAVETFEPSWFVRFLSVITNPNVALILMMVGIYGLIFEFANPGTVAPGVVGSICLLLGLYALNLLPIDYTGLALMLMGIAFLVVEAFMPTAVLGIGGVVAFVLGALMLIDAEAPGFRLSPFVIGGAAAATVGLVVLVIGYLWRSRRQPLRIGVQTMPGTRVEVVDWQDGAGHVLASGERWQARGTDVFAPGDKAEVATVEGLTLVVRRRDRKAGEGGAR
ncbi:nodulation protein NfeD [Chelatococcus sp. SYSU_G07232]|uniref:Nodulation protein NfeD n=2 Tax=Chelatococcus albus TaxID=3047466 RepID=A0ABT7AKZ2_9HYPH|nr:nodulation protein NfeD [Chelatococcus sp. SYSU_G07232]MDJ1160051.1 nodulation protein NfeD [Chelatococcus sp. SYSU_G07232]